MCVGNRFPGQACVFCPNPSVGVGEHVWPSWFIGEFHGQGSFTTSRAGEPYTKRDKVTRTFSGALKGSFRISPDMTYNVFPFVEPVGDALDQFDLAGAKLTAARDNHHGRSLASLYDSSAMPADRAAAHAEIDRLVDGVFGLAGPTESERALALLAKHHEIVASSTLLDGPPRRRRGSRQR